MAHLQNRCHPRELSCYLAGASLALSTCGPWTLNWLEQPEKRKKLQQPLKKTKGSENVILLLIETVVMLTPS